MTARKNTLTIRALYLIVVSWCFCLSAHGQILQGQVSDTLKYIDKIPHWYTTYRLTAPDYLQVQRNQFKSRAFVDTYVQSSIDFNAWMFNLLNQFTVLRTTEVRNNPHIFFNVKFKPVDNFLTNYRVEFTIGGSPQVPLNFEQVSGMISSQFFTGQTFGSPDDARGTVESAINYTMEYVANNVGSSLAPDLMVKFGSEVFWNGNEIMISRNGDNQVTLVPLAKLGRPLKPEQVQWTNATGGVVDMTGQQSKTVTLSRTDTTGTLTVTLRRRTSLSLDIKSLLRPIVLEILQQKLAQKLDSIVNMRVDSVQNANEVSALLGQVEANNVVLEGEGTLVPLLAQPMLGDSASMLQETAKINSFRELRKRKRLNEVLRTKVNVAAFTNLLIVQPEKLDELLDQLLISSGTLLGELLLNINDPNVLQTSRNIVITWLNNNMTRLAGSDFGMAPDEPITVRRVQASTPAVQFDPAKKLYISNKVAFAGKAAFETEMNAYLATVDPPLYVFINYSQDVSTEAYVARSQGARPQGLPEGARFLTLSFVNIPGSVKYQVFGSRPAVTAAADVRTFLRDYVKESVDLTIDAHIASRLQQLKDQFNFEYMAILHCETCESPTNQSTTPYQMSAITTVSSALEVGSPTISPIIYNGSQLVPDQVERITGKARACVVLYFKSEADATVDLRQGELNAAIENLPAPLLLVVDASDGSKRLDCTTELGAWSQVICQDETTASSNTQPVSLSGGYLNQLIDHVTTCLDGSGFDRIMNLTSGRLSLQDHSFIAQLYSGALAKTDGTDTRHSIKAHLIVTDYLSGSDAMSEATAFQAPTGEYKIWLHKTQEGMWELKSSLPAGAANFFLIKDVDGQAAYSLVDMLRFVGESFDMITTGIYEFLDWTAKGIEKARVPEYAWNCNAVGYDARFAKLHGYVMTIFSPLTGIVRPAIIQKLKSEITDQTILQCLNDIDAGRVDFAFYAGLWNGVVEIGKSVPDLAKLVIAPFTSLGREEFSKFLDQLGKFEKEDGNGNLVCKGAWCAIKTGLGDAFDPSKCCQFAEILGEIALPILIAWIDPAALAGAAEASSARAILQIIKVLKWLDNLGDPLTILNRPLRYVNAGLSVVRSQTKQILIRIENGLTNIENGLIKMRVLLEDGIADLSRPLEEVVLQTDKGVLFARYADGSTSKYGRVISSELTQLLEQRGVSLNKLAKLLKNSDDVESVLNRLEKTGLTDAHLNTFIDDLASVPELLAYFRSLSVVGDDVAKATVSWKVLNDAGVSQAIRADFEYVKTVSSYLDDTGVSPDNFQSALSRTANKQAFLDDLGVVAPSGKRIPKTRGTWEGTPGESLWKSDIPEVNAITDGKGIPFRNGYPDFSAWELDAYPIPVGLTGRNEIDFPLVYKEMMKDPEYNFKTQQEVQNWLSENEITLHHHQDGITIQLIPRGLHGNIPHSGGAAILRNR